MNLLAIFGGLPGIFRFLLNRLEDEADIDTAADRMCTISEKDVRKLLRGATAEQQKKALELFRTAGDKCGDALAYAARVRADML